MKNYKNLIKKAKRKGWDVPVNRTVPDVAWINYWAACELYERNPESGRPVVPHRSA